MSHDNGHDTLWPGLELMAENRGQWIEVNSPERDPDWRHVDKEGHGHFFDPAAKDYPTLRWVSLPCSMGHGDDCDLDGYWECRACTEQITPGTRIPRSPIWVDGPVDYTLRVIDGASVTVYRFGGDSLERLRAAITAACHETLEGCMVEREFRNG